MRRVAEESARQDAGLGDLADPKRCHEKLDVTGADLAELTAQLRLMMLIRSVEERIADLVESGEAVCPCHLAIGQEACAVGVAAALDTERDRAFGAHRSHGHFLALGGDATALIAEVLGKVSGCAAGMGGSMHLVDVEHGLFGTVPIVGATIPIAVGAALAAKLDGTGGVAVAFFGDGATEEGVFHESMNLASTHELPVIFACENNMYSSHLHIDLRQPADAVSRYATAHCMAWERIDGNDLLAVQAASTRAVDRARAGHGPTFIEMVTYRWRGHVGHREDMDVGVKRSSDLVLWKQRDPIRRLAEALVDAGSIDVAEVDQMWAAVSQQVDAALTGARAAEYPDASATTRYLWARS
jgi:TPP-dependent pyruvate/acetoin dehydrogenase alpha subunit